MSKVLQPTQNDTCMIIGLVTFLLFFFVASLQNPQIPTNKLLLPHLPSSIFLKLFSFFETSDRNILELRCPTL